MSFQAYLDTAEEKTGRTPPELVDLAHAHGFDAETRPGDILAWLKAEFDLGRGHGVARVGTSGSHRDESAVLRLDDVAVRTEGA